MTVNMLLQRLWDNFETAKALASNISKSSFQNCFNTVLKGDYGRQLMQAKYSRNKVLCRGPTRMIVPLSDVTWGPLISIFTYFIAKYIGGAVIKLLNCLYQIQHFSQIAFGTHWRLVCAACHRCNMPSIGHLCTYRLAPGMAKVLGNLHDCEL